MKKALVVGLVVGIAGAGVYMKGCLSKADPDERIAGRLDDLCDIAKANVDTPVRGVKKLGVYFVKHLGDITGDFGDMIAMIERISDDAKHDARAHVAHDRILHAEQACEQSWMDFANAVRNDPEAMKLVDRAGERLFRTIDILLKPPSGMKLMPAGLENEIEHLRSPQ